MMAMSVRETDTRDHSKHKLIFLSGQSWAPIWSSLAIRHQIYPDPILSFFKKKLNEREVEMATWLLLKTGVENNYKEEEK